MNKRFCSPSCRYTSPELAALRTANIKNRHELTSVDEENLTATCSVCGPTDIRERHEKRRFPGQRRWRCRGAERAAVWARHYGIEAETVHKMWSAQDERCAICRTALGRKFYIDHCHSTGRVRGLLCHYCNAGIGLFYDDPTRLAAAIEYLLAASAAH